MDNFVFEADIIVPRLESRRHKFVLSVDEMAGLLGRIPTLEIGATLTVDELQHLVRNDGEISSVLRLMGDSETRDHVLRTVAAHAWLDDIPWTVTQSTDEGWGDPRFGKLVRAYMEDLDA
jgi:hypothetical protein